ncbi:MAG: hypothetical protein FJ280_03940 [Planctomycetes bacterium]|nr:hypothetical protein [Planctomycetota bacterium]
MSRGYAVLPAVVLAWLFGSSMLCPPAAGREVRLALSPQTLPAAPGRHALLPPETLIDGDAAPLYEKALQALPGKDRDEQMYECLNRPIDQLPVEQVERTLASYTASLKWAFKAARCRSCRWSEGEFEENAVWREGYRRLALAAELWAKLEIAREGYEGAVLALQTGFGMARHLGRAPTLLSRQIGLGVIVIMCRAVEEFVQAEGSPNLYRALAQLPKPLVDVEGVPEKEKKAAEETRLLVKRFDSHLTALQCVEAIRSYTASHGGQLPGTLAEITEVAIPNDPIRGEPFHYTRTGSTAVLESAVPDGGTEAARVRYVIAVKN